jgi:hypothetical protein
MQDQDLLRRAVIKAINKAIDKKYHRLFDDPEKCLDAVIKDALEHVLYEQLLGLPSVEIDRKLQRYYVPALAKCLVKKLYE